MSDLVPQTQPKKKVLVYNTALNSATNTMAIESEALTFGDLKKEFAANNIPFNADKMSVMLGETKHTLEMDEAMLPTSSNYTIFMLPVKNKSGAMKRFNFEDLSKTHLTSAIRALKESKHSVKAIAHFKGTSKYNLHKLQDTCEEFSKKVRGTKIYFAPSIEMAPDVKAPKAPKAPKKAVTVSSPKSKEKSATPKKSWINKLKDLIITCPEPTIKEELQVVLLHYSIRTNTELTKGQLTNLETQANNMISSIKRLKQYH